MDISSTLTFRRRQQCWVDQGQCLLKKSRFLNPVKKSVSQLGLLQALKRSVHMVYGLLEQDNQETNCPICLETIAPGEQVQKTSLQSKVSKNYDGRVLVCKGCGAWLCRLPASLWPRSLLPGLACQVYSHQTHSERESLGMQGRNIPYLGSAGLCTTAPWPWCK